jgi:hypothetical protein
MAFTGSLSSEITAAQTTAIDSIMNAVFEGSVDLFYSVVTYITSFVTQGEVLGIIAAVIVIGMAYRWVRRKITS